MAPFCCTKFLHSLVMLTLVASASPTLDGPEALLRGLRIRGDQPLHTPPGKTYYYNQTIDHFNYRPKSYDTFRQRYVMVDDFWGGPENNSPIFVYLGAEQAIDIDLKGIGFLVENAPSVNALVVYIEHRYYGESNPSGTMAASLEDPEVRGYFNSAQALADYAEIIAYLKQSLKAEDSPVIVFGGSYGGMLASWFRLKYPHLAVGALASSAPVLMTVVSPDTYYDSVTRSYRDTSEKCYSTIKQSWKEMDELAHQPNGLSILSQKFSTCRNLNSASELRFYLWSIYVLAAQYNDPPKPPLGMICGAIEEGNDILDNVAASINAIRNSWIVPMDPNRTCFNVSSGSSLARLIGVNFQSGWSWQRCSEMINPFGVSSKDSMFPLSPFVLEDFVTNCKNSYGVPTRTSWIYTHYGAKDIKLFLKRFGSNIIYSNGLFDPYSQMSVLENITDTLVAVKAPKGSHCLDLYYSNSTTDPEWLTAMRNKEVEIIKGWLSTYYADLNAPVKGSLSIDVDNESLKDRSV